jgi:hypothetical protein
VTAIVYQRSYFADTNGAPLDSGKLYIGSANQDPETNPITCYWDSALTTPASQPLTITAGYVVNSGARAAVYVAAVDYSLRARNRSNVQVDYIPTSTQITGVRERLSATRTYYVRTDGSDSNNGLTNASGGAFATIQKAVNTVNALDLNGQVVIIQLGAGTYTGGVSIVGPFFGMSDREAVRIIGDETTPSNVVISTTGANALSLENFAYLSLRGVTCQVATSGIAWSVNRHSRLEHQNCRFGATAAEMIFCQQHSAVVAKGPLTVAGNAGSFVHATKRSLVDFAGQTVTFSGSPVFSTYLWGINDSSLNLDSATLTGTKTGPITVHFDGTLNASGLTGSYNGGVNLNVDSGGSIYRNEFESNQMVFYVRTDGADTNDGLVNTAAGAFRTIQYAVNAVAKRVYNERVYGGYDDVWDNCIIQVAAGTYSETVKLKNLHCFEGCTIKGDEVTPGNVIIAGVGDGIAAFGLSSKWAIKGVKITAAAGSAIRANRGAFVAFQNVEFGAVTGGYHILAEDGAQILATGNYAISGAAPAHVLLRNSSANLSGRTLTITGTPAFATAFAYLEDGSNLRIVGNTFTGSATGVRYSANGLSVINTNGGGATYLPGGTGGSTAGGGQYV